MGGNNEILEGYLANEENDKKKPLDYDMIRKAEKKINRNKVDLQS